MNTFAGVEIAATLGYTFFFYEPDRMLPFVTIATADAEEFFRRLNQIGGPPARWRIYPHAAGDGRVLHFVAVESWQDIRAHLRHFDDIDSTHRDRRNPGKGVEY